MNQRSGSCSPVPYHLAIDPIIRYVFNFSIFFVGCQLLFINIMYIYYRICKKRDKYSLYEKVYSSPTIPVPPDNLSVSKDITCLRAFEFAIVLPFCQS